MSTHKGLSTRCPNAFRKIGSSLSASISGFECLRFELVPLAEGDPDELETATEGVMFNVDGELEEGTATALLTSCGPNTVLSLRLLVNPKDAICGWMGPLLSRVILSRLESSAANFSKAGA